MNGPSESAERVLAGRAAAAPSGPEPPVRRPDETNPSRPGVPLEEPLAPPPGPPEPEPPEPLPPAPEPPEPPPWGAAG